MSDNQDLQNRFNIHYIDLASERIGGKTLSCSDDFFAEMSNMLKPGRGIFIDDKYTDRGKWMDGWESRRSYGRDNGREYDWCIIRLGVAGVIHGVDVDTNHFRGNAPQQVSIEACNIKGHPDDNTEWISILGKSGVDAHSQNLFEIDSRQVWTHVRLNIFPDGGVARFRVYGEAKVNWDEFVPGEMVDLAYIKNGGRAELASDMFFGVPNNLLMPGKGKNMGDGWETKRRRDPGPDWCIVKLGSAGSINRVIIDTHHFKGNFPDSFMLEGCYIDKDDFVTESTNWQPVIAQTKLEADHEHTYIDEVIPATTDNFTHVRLNIFPDGGVSRMRVFGFREEEAQ